MSDDPQNPLAAIFPQVAANIAGTLKLARQVHGNKKTEVAHRKWVTALIEGADRVQAQLAALDNGIDFVAAFELSHALRDVYPPIMIEEIEAEYAEMPANRKSLHASLRSLEQRSEEGLLLAEALFAAALDHIQLLQETSMQSERETELSATIVQTIVETLPNREFLADLMATMSASNAAIAAPALRKTGVGPQFAQTRDALGLPALDSQGRREEARSLMIEALKRRFAFRDGEGFRTYYLIDRAPLSPRISTQESSGPSLHGAGRYQLEMLDSNRVLLFRLLDEHVPRPTDVSERLRDQIGTILDDITTLLSNPLGPTPGQGEGRFRRLVLAVADWLELGGSASCTILRRAAANDKFSDLLKALASPENCATVGATIPTRETDLRIAAIHQALQAIGTIVERLGAMDPGRAFAELAEAMKLLYTPAVGLREALRQTGLPLDEQEMAYFNGRRHPDVSVAQFAAWVEDISAPFAASEDEAAMMRLEDYQVLARDIDELLRLSGMLEHYASTYAAELRLIAARKFAKEIGYLLRRAQDALANVIADKPAAAA